MVNDFWIHKNGSEHTRNQKEIDAKFHHRVTFEHQMDESICHAPDAYPPENQKDRIQNSFCSLSEGNAGRVHLFSGKI